MSSPAAARTANSMLDNPDERRRWLESLSPNDLESVRSYAWDRLLRARKVKVDGKQLSLKALHDLVTKQQEEFECGLYNDDQRTVSRLQAQNAVPSRYMRLGSYKQVLREEEEQSLGLQRMGHGNCLTSRKLLGALPLLPQRHFAYGIFARPDRVQALFSESWAGKDPNVVLHDEAYFLDILRRCHQLELTLMLLTSRPLPLPVVRREVEGALKHSMQRLKNGNQLSKTDCDSLSQFVRQLDDRRLVQSGWVEGNSICKGTHIILSATAKGGLTAEAITPGAIGERKTSFIATCHNPLLTAAVFDIFLGPKSVDPIGRRACGSGVLWAANGLSFFPQQCGGAQVGLCDTDGRMQLPQDTVQENLPCTTSIFELGKANQTAPLMLMDNISGNRQL